MKKIIENMESQNRILDKLSEDLPMEEAKQYRAELSKLRTRHVQLLKENESRPAPVSLVDKINVRNYMRAEAKGIALDGAEKELNEELKLSEGYNSRIVMPMAALLRESDKEDLRKRAVTLTTAKGTDQRDIIQRIFKDSESAYIGIQMPSVGVGDVRYPVITAGGAGKTVAAGVKVDVEANTIKGETLSPKRASISYDFQVEQSNTIQGLESSLREDLRMALSEHLDEMNLNGTGADGQPTGLFKSTNFFGSDGATVVTSDTMIEEAAAIVDGKHSYMLSGTKCLMNPDLYKILASKFRSTGDKNALALLADAGVDVRVSSRIPIIDSKQAFALLIAPRGVEIFCPLWSGLEIIRDNITNAPSGVTRITGIMLYDFKAVRTDGLTGTKIKTA